MHEEHKNNGFFRDPRDIALAFSTDSLALFTVGTDSVWPLLLINLNLVPAERFKKHNILLCGVIPGPKNPKDIQSFLRPLVDELKELAAGIDNVYDAFTKTHFTLRAHLVLVTADLPATAKTMGICGHGHTTIVDSARSMASTKALSIAHYEHLMVNPSHLPSIMILFGCLFETMPRTGELRARRFNMKPSTVLLKEEQSTESHNIQSSTN